MATGDTRPSNLVWAAASLLMGAFWTTWAIRTDEPGWVIVVSAVLFPVMAVWFALLYRRDRRRAEHH